MKLIQPLTPEIIEKRRRFGRKILGVPGRIWRKTRRFFFWTLAIGFVLHCALNIYASTLLNRELSAIRQKGEPLKLAEMEPPAVPDSQNAALIYKRAFDSLEFSREEEESFHILDSQRTPQQNLWIEAALVKNQKALDLARRAALMPRCVFPLDYQTDNPTALLFPYYSEMRELARLLVARAKSKAKNGESEAALSEVRAVFGMAHHLSNEPVLIGFLVAQAIDSIANQGLAQVLESVPMTSLQATQFKDSLPKTNWNRAFIRCLTGERAWEIFAYKAIGRPGDTTLAEINALSGDMEESDGQGNRFSWIYYPLILLWHPVLKLDEVQNLRLWRKQLDAAANPHSAFSQFNHSFERDIENLPRYAVLTRLLMPVFSQVSNNRDRAEVRRRQREIALALAVFRTRNGQYPPQLLGAAKLWGKSLPLDPYAKKPFVYRPDKSGKGFTLYSVGINRTNDAGQNGTNQLSNGSQIVTGDDIIWGNPRR